MERLRNLSWLINPYSVEEFTSRYFENETLLIRRSDNAYYENILSEAEVERIVYVACRLSNAVEELTEDDKPKACRTPSAIDRCLAMGRSVRVNSIQRFAPHVRELAANMTQAISMPINVNMYLSPGSGSKALDRHYDTHDVFVLQIHGRKIWRLFDSPVEAPLEFLPLQRHESIDQMKRSRLKKNLQNAKSTTLVSEFVLASGDLLYLPRGAWHEAESPIGEVSCHLTVGVQAVTYLELTALLLAEYAKNHPSLRHALPLGYLTHLSAEDKIKSILERTFPAIDFSPYLEEVLQLSSKDLIKRQSAVCQTNMLRFIDRRPSLSISPGARFALRRGVIATIVKVETSYHFSTASYTFEVPNSLEEACRRVITGEPFTIDVLETLTSSREAKGLVRQLLEAEILEPIDARSNDRPILSGRLPTLLNVKRGFIVWEDLHSSSPKEPFFSQSIRRARDVAKTYPIRTDLTVLKELSSLPGPRGLVFHMSRCGSTLLANTLREFPKTRVISEAPPVSAALRVKDGKKRCELLLGIINAFCRSSMGEDNATVLKLSSWNIYHIDLFRSLWPETPIVVVVRNPLEVAVSCLRQAPGWLRRKENTHSKHMAAHEDIKIRRSEMCARELAKFLEIAVRLQDSVKILDHKNLDSGAVDDVACLFGLDRQPDTGTRVRDRMLIYSKDPTQITHYRDDSIAKRADADTDLCNAINQAAMPLYLALEAN